MSRVLASSFGGDADPWTARPNVADVSPDVTPTGGAGTEVVDGAGASSASKSPRGPSVSGAASIRPPTKAGNPDPGAEPLVCIDPRRTATPSAAETATSVVWADAASGRTRWFKGPGRRTRIGDVTRAGGASILSLFGGSVIARKGDTGQHPSGATAPPSALAAGLGNPRRTVTRRRPGVRPGCASRSFGDSGGGRIRRATPPRPRMQLPRGCPLRHTPRRVPRPRKRFVCRASGGPVSLGLTESALAAWRRFSLWNTELPSSCKRDSTGAIGPPSSRAPASCSTSALQLQDGPLVPGGVEGDGAHDQGGPAERSSSFRAAPLLLIEILPAARRRLRSRERPDGRRAAVDYEALAADVRRERRREEDGGMCDLLGGRAAHRYPVKFVQRLGRRGRRGSDRAAAYDVRADLVSAVLGCDRVGKACQTDLRAALYAACIGLPASAAIEPTLTIVPSVPCSRNTRSVAWTACGT